MQTKSPTTVQITDHDVTLERVYETSPQRLFDAWTKADLVAQWLAPGPMTCKAPVYDAKKGGRFRIEMSGKAPDGKPMTFVYDGTFDDLVPGKRVVMTWNSKNHMTGEPDPPSVVTVTFTPVATGTKMRLTQGMPNAEYGKHAAGGWQYALEQLAKLG